MAWAVIGLCWGSFLGLVIERVPAGASVLRPPSHCPACGRRLRALDLVPIVSWVALRGRCRTCRAALPARLLLIEIASGAAFAAASAVASGPVGVVLVGLFLSTSIALALIDLATGRLPDAVVLPGFAVAGALIVAGAASGEPLSIRDAAIGAAALGGGLWIVVIASRGGMGFGDVKYGALIGLVVGARDLASVAVAAGVAILVGGLAGIVALLRGADRRTALPFGPMLALGSIVAVLVGPSVAAAYLDLLR